jgi:hypothetical membrane protein
MTFNNGKLAGLLLSLGSTVGFLGIIIAETLYPRYSTANNYISDLGIGPSAAVFNVALTLGGLLGLAGVYLLSQGVKSRLFIAFIGLSSLGSFLVGVFPEDMGLPHVFAALLAFLFGSASAILAYRFTNSPFRYLSAALGATSLGAFLLFGAGAYLGLGVGGMERMIAYPNLLWSIGFGAYLMAESNSRTVYIKQN